MTANGELKEAVVPGKVAVLGAKSIGEKQGRIKMG